MHIKHIKSLRTFIFLLLTVFMVNTVYASGMMSVIRLPSTNNSAVEYHLNNDDHSAHQNHHQKHRSESKQERPSDDHCSKCTHCMACMSYLSPSEFNKIDSQIEEASILLFKPNYLSYIRAQPQRPPIS